MLPMQNTNNFSYDLHSHTTESDGSLTVSELLMRADIKQVNALAITDHDTINGLVKAKQYIEEQSLKIQLVNGVEISTKWHGFEIHVIGLCLDLENEQLNGLLTQQQSARRVRAKLVAEKLEKKGYGGIYQEAFDLAGSDHISRTHFAKALINRGGVAHFNGAFKKYLGKGKSCYVAADWVSIEEAVAAINAAGGIAVLAHPIRYDMSNKWLAKLVAQFAEAKGSGIEVGLTQITPNQRTHLSNLAQQHGLYSSQGSDFHGPARWIELGRSLKLGENCKPVWDHPKWRFA